MAYRPGSAAFNFTSAPYRPPKPLDFNFDGTPDIDIAPPPAITMSVSAGWAKSKTKDRRENSTSWQSPPEKQRSTRTAWSTAAQLNSQSQLDWLTVERKELELQTGWAISTGKDKKTKTSWLELNPKDSFSIARWDRSLRAQDMRRMRLMYRPLIPAKDTAVQIGLTRTDELGRIPDAQSEFAASIYIPNTQPVHFVFKGRQYTPPEIGLAFFNFRYVAPKYQTQPKDSIATRIRWGTARRVNHATRLRWGWGIPTDPRPTGIVYPDYNGPVIIIPDEPLIEPELKDTYMIANTVSVCVLPDCTPIDVTSISIDLDIDSYSWVFSGSLFGAASLQQVMPGTLGQKTIKVTINGHEWLFVIESYSSIGKFPAERYTIKGASRTQLLAEPYAPKRSGVNAVSINARQAAEDQLLNTGFSMRWDSINENPVDWNIPAGALTYQDQTPMQIISRIAESIGAIVRPAAAADEFSVLPRYRDAVWYWNNTLVDRIVPHQVVTDIGGEWSPQPTWNSCYVSGTTQGVAVDVRRAGTAGDKPAADVYDDLITTSSAARARGIAEICKGGNQEVVSMAMPLFPPEKAPGLVLPAMLCEVQPHNEANWRGLCLATSINASGTGASMVKQTIRLERHHGNS